MCWFCQFENSSLSRNTIAECFSVSLLGFPLKETFWVQLQTGTDCAFAREPGVVRTQVEAGAMWQGIAWWVWSPACNPQHWKLNSDCACWGFGLMPRLEACHVNKVSNHQNFSFTNLGFCFALFCLLLLLFLGVLGYFVCFLLCFSVCWESEGLWIITHYQVN